MRFINPANASFRLWVFIGGATLLLSILGFTFHYVVGIGDKLCEGRHSKALAASIVRAQEQARALALQDAEVLQSGVMFREKIRVVYRDREVQIVKHISPDCMRCSITADGLRLLNDAITKPGNRTDPGKLTHPLPGPATAPGRAVPDRDTGFGSPSWKIL